MGGKDTRSSSYVTFTTALRGWYDAARVTAEARGFEALSALATIPRAQRTDRL